jgi:hypothetical protein
MIPMRIQAQASPWIRLAVNAIPVYITADPVPRGGSLGEVRLVQPTVMAHAGALRDRLRFVATLNLEGLTMPDGELAPGDWGEGFMDRRHPHTYAHEAVLTYDQPVGRAALSLSAGKGFAPFGTDDPMSRPVLRYPVNHHLAQILERAVVILGVRSGPVLLEGGLFNGDEPDRPSRWPKVSRFGDSWSGRLTLFPLEHSELQASYADVHSPEHREGFGTDQHKWSVSGRWTGLLRRAPAYAMLEWARTSEAEGFFVFHSLLGEGAWTLGRHRLLYRFERTERPEEERIRDPFRSIRPHIENSILGTTRWTIHTAGYGFQLDAVAGIQAAPFVEISLGRVADVGDGLFSAESFYGKSTFWSLTIGARLNAGLPLHRMGRYGVAQDTAAGAADHHHDHHDHDIQ